MGNGVREGGARQTLREFYEQLDRKWQEAEQLLLSLNVPAAVTVRVKTVEPEHRPGSRHHHELGFIRHYGQWGLCYGIRSADDPADGLWTAIRRCSVEQRVEAARCFPELRDKVVQAAEGYAAEVERAVGVLTRSLDDTAAPSDAMAESIVPTPAVPEWGEDESCTLPLPQRAMSDDTETAGASVPDDWACETLDRALSAEPESLEDEAGTTAWETRPDATEEPTVADAGETSPPVPPRALLCWETDGGQTMRPAEDRKVA